MPVPTIVNVAITIRIEATVLIKIETLQLTLVNPIQFN